MSVQSLINSVCDRINISRPSTLVSASVSTPHDKQIHALLVAVAEELRQAACWTQQKRSYTFTTSNGVTSYELPADFYCALPFTHWNSDENRRLDGPAADGDFTELLYVGSAGPNFNYRLFGFNTRGSAKVGEFKVNPTPSGTINLVFEYMTKNLFVPTTWNSATDYALYETITANSDLCIFDEDLVKLGLRAKWYEDKGEGFEAAKAEFEKKISAAKARFNGSYIGSFARGSSKPRYTYPFGGW